MDGEGPFGRFAADAFLHFAPVHDGLLDELVKVANDPVNDKAAREVQGHPADHDRHHEQHGLLVARCVLRGGLPRNDEGGGSREDRKDVGLIRYSQAFQPQEALVGRIIGKALECVVDGDQEWHLDEERQAAGERRGSVFLVELAHFFTQLLRIILVFLLDLLHFRLNGLHGLHGPDLFQGEREQQRLDNDGQDDDGDPIARKSQVFCHLIAEFQADAHDICEESD